jgi:hypothetical protein
MCLRVGRASLVLGWLLIACAQLAGAQLADDAAALERRVKAAYLFKIASYVEWPAGTFTEPASPIRVAILGDDDLAAELAQIAEGRNVDGRPLAVRKTRDPDAATEAHILFVGRPDIARLPQISRNMRGKPVVIVTDSPGALNQGSVINFVLADQHVKFEIALDEAERRNVKLSSRLLGVAHNVRKAAP